MLDFPSNPLEGDVHRDPSSDQSWVWTQGAWVFTSAAAAEQVIVGGDVASGWTVVGDNLICWGTGNSGGSGNLTLPFPREFKTAPSVNITSSQNNNSGVSNAAFNITTTNFGAALFNITGGYRANFNFTWIAIGEALDADKKPKSVFGGVAEAASGGNASVSVGDTLPLTPAHGNQHYLTIEPVGMYVYIDENELGSGTDAFWVQQNGGGATEISPVEIVGGGGASGWTVVGSTLIQWGSATGDSNGQSSVNFQKVFGGTPYVAVTPRNVGSPALSSTYTAYVRAASTTGCSLGGTTGTFGAFGVGWIAIGEALDADKKPTEIGSPLGPNGKIADAFHDPTGVASWRIDYATNTLECWGEYLGDSGSVITFPKTFARPPAVQVTGQSTDVVPRVAGVDQNTRPTTTEATLRMHRTVNEAPSVGRVFSWFARGEWDGVS